MKLYSFTFENSEKFINELTEYKKECDAKNISKIGFNITWCSDQNKEVREVISIIENVFPEALYYGNQGAGSIVEGEYRCGVYVTSLICENENTGIDTVFVKEGTELSSLEDLWKYCRKKDKLKAVELIPSSSYVFKMGIHNHIPDVDDDVLVFGGAAFNSFDMSIPTMIVDKKHGFTSDGMIAVIYYGDGVDVTVTDILGWKGLGKQLTVTETSGKDIISIDNRPAFYTYEKYLDLKPNDTAPLVFPLILEEDGNEFIRIPEKANEDKSITMLAEVYKGAKVRVSFGDKNTILESLTEKAQSISKFQPDIIKVISCAARKLFWGINEISKESEIFNRICTSNGFYSSSEIMKFGNKLKVLNETLVVVSLKEKVADSVNKETAVIEMPADKSVASRLAFFTEKVVEEQKLANKQLEEDKELLSVLAKGYFSLYYINLFSHDYTVYRFDDEKIPDIVPLLNAYKDAFLALSAYGQSPAVYPDDRHYFTELTPDFVRNSLEKTKKYTFRFRRLFDNKYNWCECDIVKLENENEEAGSFVIGFADRDKQIRNEEEQRQQLKDALSMAQSANVAKTAFLNNMSHDIRTPMNAIIGYTRLAQKNIDDKDQALDYLAKINQSSEHLLSLINDVLDMSRIESGKMTLDEKEEDLLDIGNSLYDMVKANVEAKNLDFSLKLDGLNNRYVFCDKLRLNQVLLNLLSNSIKYTPVGGNLSLTIKDADTTQDEEFSTVIFSVKDNGMGMSQEFLKTIFDPFTRVKSSTVSGIQGTGLGMAITKNLVDLMHGTIRIESELEKGTEVIVTFSFKRQTNPVETKVDEFNDIELSDINFKGKKVLLVEDNELNREIATEILEEYGMIIECAEDGDIAVDKMKTATPTTYDVVLMDIQMPRLNGYEATKIIRSMGTPVSRIPIIAMTANAFDEDHKAALAAGMDEHITKPINIEQLSKALAKFL